MTKSIQVKDDYSAVQIIRACFDKMWGYEPSNEDEYGVQQHPNKSWMDIGGGTVGFIKGGERFFLEWEQRIPVVGTINFHMEVPLANQGEAWQLDQRIRRLDSSRETRARAREIVSGRRGEYGLGDATDLAGFAAQAAAKVLAENWQQALDEGEGVEQLTPDVDDVVAMLRAWQEGVKESYAEERRVS
jgi:hypothetical protein